MRQCNSFKINWIMRDSVAHAGPGISEAVVEAPEPVTRDGLTSLGDTASEQNEDNQFPKESDEHLEYALHSEICDQLCPCTSTFSSDSYTCGGTGGWRRAVYLDITDCNANCPSGWSETGYSSSTYSSRTCGRATDGRSTCDSAYFPVCGGGYSQVCGRIKAYQYGWSSGFGRAALSTVDDQYFSGVAVMHGSPRGHIWTFVAGAAENWPSPNAFLCPCDINYAGHSPSFIDNDYFCESGYLYPVSGPQFSGFHTDDPLWDGRGCDATSTCCTFNDPPTFTRDLGTTTDDDLELRLCNYYRENTAVELVEIYVK